MVLLLLNLLVKIVECTRIPFYFQHHWNEQQSKSSQKRGVPKLKGILKNHLTTFPMVSPFDPWCDGEEVDKIDREDVLDTVGKPIFATHCE
jgi:hypothetical protein